MPSIKSSRESRENKREELALEKNRLMCERLMSETEVMPQYWTTNRLNVEEINDIYTKFITNMRETDVTRYNALDESIFKRLRDEKGFTQTRAAFILGISQARVSKRYNAAIASNCKYLVALGLILKCRS